MGHSIFKYGSLMLPDIETLEQAKEKARKFVTPEGREYIEIQDSDGETVAIGYFDGKRFHWDEDKIAIESAKRCSWIVKPPLWWGEERLKKFLDTGKE